MSRQSSRSTSERELVQWARARGWQVIGRNARNHLMLLHPQSGARRVIPSKVDFGRLRRAVRTQLAKLESCAMTRKEPNIM